MLPRPVPHPVRLDDLVAGVPDTRLTGEPSTVITGVELDSRAVRPGDLFAALPGHLTHGAAFAAAACGLGAAAVLTDSDGLLLMGDVGVPVVVVDRPRAVLGELARRAYGAPGDELILLGITGTNGKTTIAAMIESGLHAAGIRAGLVGTVAVHIGDQVLPATRTTPEAPHLHALLAGMRDAGVRAVAVEVSSHALMEGRVDGLRFDVAGFTHLTQDHLDYHGTMEEYFAAKSTLFTPQRSALGIVGIDDDWGRRLVSTATVPVQTWSARGAAADWGITGSGEDWQVDGPAGERQRVAVRLPGTYNAANALCAYAMLRSVGVDPAAAAEGIANVRVPGRMERVDADGGILGIVDYAHSPDAIARAIDAVRPQLAGRIIVVLGAGGDRDASKRPLMGEAAARSADIVIVTDDNPRSEDPGMIRRAVLQGARAVRPADSVWAVPDRREAIRQAVGTARAGDAVLLLGKGHEQGQEINAVMVPFDDRDELRQALLDRQSGAGS